MRLIDADALKKEFPKDTDWEYPTNTNEYVCEKIDAQPTVQLETNCSEIPNNSDTTTHDSIPAKTGKNDGDGTSGDCISRQAMLDGIDKLIKIHFDRTVVLYKARKVAEDLPSVQPEQRWIPCSERQPDVNGWYVTTISGEICGQDRAFSGMSEFANGKWMSGDDADETEMTIAWCPLPEPYQGGEQG